MTAPPHRTETGHVPAGRAVSWSCACGDGEIWDYGNTVDAEWAMRLAATRATTHRGLADLRGALQ